MKSKVIQGNNIDILKGYPDNHFDSIVTDPPYGIEFLHKEWDNNTGAVETWAECFRVLKPGGYLLAFSAARTYHNLATNIEGVGFDIRDQLMWLYASGFPKAQDVGKAIQKRQGVEKTKPAKPGLNAYANDKPLMERMSFANLKAEDYPPKNAETICTSPEAQQWSGWKTALKPAHEPIVMARKPFKGSCVDNVLEHGVGALNIDASRVLFEDETAQAKYLAHRVEMSTRALNANNPKTQWAGAWDETVETNNLTKEQAQEQYKDIQGKFPSNVLGEVEDYQKFFYCPKVSRAERHCGFEQTNIPTTSGGMYDNHGTGKMYSIGTDMKSKVDPLAHIPKNPDGMLDAHYKKGEKGNPIYNNQKTSAGNNHPTVKPVALMKYLIKLVTPQGGKILDPFTGSGSTGMAAVELDYDFTG